MMPVGSPPPGRPALRCDGGKGLQSATAQKRTPAAARHHGPPGRPGRAVHGRSAPVLAPERRRPGVTRYETRHRNEMTRPGQQPIAFVAAVGASRWCRRPPSPAARTGDIVQPRDDWPGVGYPPNVPSQSW